MNFENTSAYADADYLSGDPIAFSALVVKFQGGLFGFLGRMGFSQAESEELAQEAFLRIWKNRSSYDARKAAISTWVFTVAKNLALNEIAKNRPEVADEIDVNTLRDKQVGSDPGAQYESHQAVDNLQQALRTLSVEDRTVIAAIYTPDMNTADVVTVLNCSEAALRTRLSRARQRLTMALRESDDEHE